MLATQSIAVIAALLVNLDTVLASAAAEATRPSGGYARNIVSINLCADQLLLRLAQRERIASVSHLAANPLYSEYHDRVGDIALNHGRIEEIIALQPDLVLAYQYSDVQVIHMLRHLGVRVAVIPAPSNLDDVASTITAIAALLDERRKGADLRAQMAAELMPEPVPHDRTRPLAVIYAPGGYSPGALSLAGALLEAAGFRNLSAELGNDYGATLPLEQLLMHQPDLIIVDDDEPDKNSLAQRRLEHPALQRGMRNTRTVRLTGRYWSCPTPAVSAAVTELRSYR